MALVVESYSSGTATSSNNVTVTKPTGVTAGDLLVIIGNSSGSTFACSGFTLGGTWLYDGPGGISDCEVKLLYRIADSSDVSASNYTVTGSSSENGIVAMFRISGWSSGNPIYQSAAAGWAPTVSGTHTVSGLSIPRVGNQILIMVGASYDNTDSDYIGNFASYTVTSGDSNPSWTEVVDTNVTTGSGALGRKSLGVAYATTTSTSTITAFSFGYTEFDADDKAGAIGVLITIEEPISASPNVEHLAVTPTANDLNVTQVNQGAEVEHVEFLTTLNNLESRATSPTQWSAESKPSTSWTKETI